MVMSAVALAIVVLHLVRFGAARQADEGASAHLWQLLMAAQIPLLAIFVVKWLPQNPKRGLLVLLLQAISAAAALLPVYLLHW